MKKITTILVALFTCGMADAQDMHVYAPHWEAGDTLVFAFDRDWEPIDNLKAATYYRKTYPLEEEVYRVVDYYKSGQVQMLANARDFDPAYSYTVYYGEKVYFNEAGDTSSYYLYDNDGNPMGTHYSTYENGQTAFVKTYLSDGKKVTYKGYFDNGTLEYDYTLINGKKDGLYKEYHKTGELYQEGIYVEGEEHGLWKLYHENGAPMVEKTYKDGIIHGDYVYKNKDGLITTSGKYKKGNRTGIWEFKHDNGAVEAVIKYDDGNREGEVKYFSDKGVVLKEGKYEEDEPVGTHREYNEEGELVRETVFDRGYPALKTTVYMPESGFYSIEEDGVKTYYKKTGEELAWEEIQADPKPEKNFFAYFFGEYAKLPENLKLTEGRGIYSFVITATGEVDSVMVSESMTDTADGLFINALKGLRFEPGESFGEHTGFLQSVAVRVEEGKLVAVESGNYTTSGSGPEELTYTIVEEMPHYPGGEAELFKYLGENTKYPSIARDAGVQGVVYITFVVNENGMVTNPKILRGVHPSVDMEAVWVIKKMPTWSAGKQRGKNVRVQYNLPIRFILR